MTREEFILIRDELTKVVINFEILQRKIHFLKCSYFIEYNEELEQELYLKYENQYLSQAIIKKADGESLESIAEYLESCQKEFDIIVRNFQNKYKNYQEMAKRLDHYTATDMEKLDQEFADYCSLYHPVIKAHSTPLESNIYSTLASLYRTGNVVGFRNVLLESKDSFTSTAVALEEYDVIASFYKESLENLKALTIKCGKEFPLDRENIFIDEAAHIREQTRLRENNYKLREANISLHNDFKLNFEKDFSL